jgi:hypothetical protein
MIVTGACGLLGLYYVFTQSYEEEEEEEYEKKTDFVHIRRQEALKANEKKNKFQQKIQEQLRKIFQENPKIKDNILYKNFITNILQKINTMNGLEETFSSLINYNADDPENPATISSIIQKKLNELGIYIN